METRILRSSLALLTVVAACSCSNSKADSASGSPSPDQGLDAGSNGAAGASGDNAAGSGNDDSTMNDAGSAGEMDAGGIVAKCDAASIAAIKGVIAPDEAADSTDTPCVPESPGPESGDLPAGYTACGAEGATCELDAPSHVAYGAPGSYSFKYNVTGSIVLDNNTFGDPAPGVAKSGYFKPADVTAATTALAAALAWIHDDIKGVRPLTVAQRNQQRRTIDAYRFYMGYDVALLKTAIEIVQHYESNTGPFFLSARTPPRFAACAEAEDGLELDRAVFSIQQGLHDAITSELLTEHPCLFDGLKYQTAAYFPGDVAPPNAREASYEVEVNATMPQDWGRRTAFSRAPVRRPTGAYLAPGSIAVVTVPDTLVDQGFAILVGSHTWFKGGRERFEQVTKTYPITSTSTQVANPFGGGIYLVVPYQASAGPVTLKLQNTVRSPLFSSTSLRTTSAAEWQNSERMQPGPWADFETDKFMLNVPRSWIYAFDGAPALMAEWDKAMDGVSELLGYPLVRNNVVLYLQPDVSIGHSVYGIGYPQPNNTYDPLAPENGNKDHWVLRDPIGWNTEYHELGHASLFPAFSGETESSVHLLFAYTKNVKFGADLDTAFSESSHAEEASGQFSLDQTAINWMVRPNFRDGLPMDISNSELNEVRYQHRGHAKYIDIASLFGWEAIKDHYYQSNVDAESGVVPPDTLSDTDRRIRDLSSAAGADLTPLIHFWGVHPSDPGALAAAIAELALPQSQRVYDRLEYYRGLIPADNAAFMEHYLALYPDEPAGTSPNYGAGWYTAWKAQYGAAEGTAASDAVTALLDLYFPEGRPTTDAP